MTSLLDLLIEASNVFCTLMLLLLAGPSSLLEQVVLRLVLELLRFSLFELEVFLELVEVLLGLAQDPKGDVWI